MRMLLAICVLTLGLVAADQDPTLFNKDMDNLVVDVTSEERLYACAFHFMSENYPMTPAEWATDMEYLEHVNNLTHSVATEPVPRFCADSEFYEEHDGFCNALNSALDATSSLREEGSDFRHFCRGILLGMHDDSLLETDATKHAAKHKGKIHNSVREVAEANGFFGWFKKKPTIAEIDKRTCLFLHGAGYAPGKQKFSNDHYYRMHDEATKYNWGDKLPKAASDYCTPVFYFYDSLHNSYKDDVLAQHFCKAVEHSKARQVYTHSMGNLVLAHGIEKGLPGCQRIGTGPNDVHWFSVQGPLEGSEAANVLQDLCLMKKKGYIENNRLWDAHRHEVMTSTYSNKLAAMKGSKMLIFVLHARYVVNMIAEMYCKIDPVFENVKNPPLHAFTGETYPCHFDLQVPIVEPGTFEDTVNSKAVGSMCGTTPKSDCGSIFKGFTTSQGLQAIGSKCVNWADYGPENDGLVGVKSCMLKSANYGHSTDDAHALLAVSHLDATAQNCHTTRGKAIKWYKGRLEWSAKQPWNHSFLETEEFPAAARSMSLSELEEHVSNNVITSDPVHDDRAIHPTKNYKMNLASWHSMFA